MRGRGKANGKNRLAQPRVIQGDWREVNALYNDQPRLRSELIKSLKAFNKDGLNELNTKHAKEGEKWGELIIQVLEALQKDDLLEMAVVGAKFDGVTFPRALPFDSQNNKWKFSSIVFNNCEFANHEWTDATLEEMKFTNCEFDGLSWDRINLNNCQFDQCKFLATPSFKSCQGKDNTFSNCKFETASFSWNDFDNLKFNNCDLNGTQMHKCTMQNMEIRSGQALAFKATETRFTSPNLTGIDLKDSKWDQCNFDGGFFDSSVMNGAKFSRSDFDGTIVRDTELARTVWVKNIINDVYLKGINLCYSRLEDNRIDNCDFTKAQLMQTQLIDNTWGNPQFNGANFWDSDYDLVKLSPQQTGLTAEMFKDIEDGGIPYQWDKNLLKHLGLS